MRGASPEEAMKMKATAEASARFKPMVPKKYPKGTKTTILGVYKANLADAQYKRIFSTMEKMYEASYNFLVDLEEVM